MQVADDVIIDVPPTTREPERPLQREATRPFVNLEALSSILNTCIPLWKLLQMIPNLRHVLGGLRMAN